MLCYASMLVENRSSYSLFVARLAASLTQFLQQERPSVSSRANPIRAIYSNFLTLRGEIASTALSWSCHSVVSSRNSFISNRVMCLRKLISLYEFVLLFTKYCLQLQEGRNENFMQRKIIQASYSVATLILLFNFSH